MAADNSQKHYAKWKKPITKDYITQYDSIHKNLQNLQIKKQSHQGLGWEQEVTVNGNEEIILG